MVLLPHPFIMLVRLHLFMIFGAVVSVVTSCVFRMLTEDGSTWLQVMSFGALTMMATLACLLLVEEKIMDSIWDSQSQWEDWSNPIKIAGLSIGVLAGANVHAPFLALLGGMLLGAILTKIALKALLNLKPADC